MTLDATIRSRLLAAGVTIHPSIDWTGLRDCNFARDVNLALESRANRVADEIGVRIEIGTPTEDDFRSCKPF